MGVRGATGLVAALLVWLVPTSGAAAEPRVERGGGDSGTVGTEITVPGAPGRSGQGVPEQASVVSARGPAPCTFRPLSPEEALAAGLLSPDDGGVENLWDTGGQYVLRDCRASGGSQLVMWVPDVEGSASPAGVGSVTPEVLAQEARSTLQLPEPAVGVSPDGANQNPALVNLPTWWWVTNGDEMTQRTALGGVWAEVTAEPVSSAWVSGRSALVSASPTCRGCARTSPGAVLTPTSGPTRPRRPRSRSFGR